MKQTARRLPGLLLLFCLIVIGQAKIANAQTTANVRKVAQELLSGHGP